MDRNPSNKPNSCCFTLRNIDVKILSKKKSVRFSNTQYIFLYFTHTLVLQLEAVGNALQRGKGLHF